MLFNISVVYHFLFLFSIAQSKTFNTKSIQEVQEALKKVSNKDIIQLDDGIYASDVKWTVLKNEVTLRAKNIGKVILSGLVHINLSGNNNTLSGFQFLNYLPKSPLLANAAKNVIEINGDFNLVTECNFVNYTAKRYIHISAHTRHNTIAFCNFENKPTTSPSGSLVQLLPHPSGAGSFHRISHCTFQRIYGKGGDFGNEPVRIGLGDVSCIFLEFQRLILVHK
jgi:hypothetical protein